MSRLGPWIAVVGMLAMSAIGQAQVYRWQDENGHVTYGNLPPAGVHRLTRIDESNLPPDTDRSRWGYAANYRQLGLPPPLKPSESNWPSTVDRSTVAALGAAFTRRVEAPRRIASAL